MPMDRSVPIGKFWWIVGYMQRSHLEWRYGQTTFNILDEMRPDLSAQIRGTDFDASAFTSGHPRLDRMCQWIQEHWDDDADGGG